MRLLLNGNKKKLRGLMTEISVSSGVDKEFTFSLDLYEEIVPEVFVLVPFPSGNSFELVVGIYQETDVAISGYRTEEKGGEA